MFPFVFDPRPASTLFNSSKRVTRSTSRGTNIPSEIKDSFPAPPSSYPTATPPRYATRSGSGSGNSGNSLRNPYSFVQPRPSYSPSASTKKRSSSTTSSSASSTKSRLAAINSAYDSQYGEFSGHGTAEEIRNTKQTSHPAPDISFTDPSVPRSRSPTSSTNSDDDSSSVKSRSLRRLVKDKTKAVLGLKRSGSTSGDDGDDQDRLMGDEGQ